MDGVRCRPTHYRRVREHSGGPMMRRLGALAVVLVGLGIQSQASAYDGPAADRDKDTVPDNVDACPDTPGVKTNEAKTNGCPNNPWGAPAGASDRDQDRIPDSLDACPDT